MHDTAFHIGSLAMNIYADLRTASILEIGSQSINGSLRENALPTTKYVGVDIEEGEGVDIVVEAGQPLPVEDSTFDLVMATSVFEHDPCFWTTFLEMCRSAKDGAYIYISAPSNGVVHRYPQDNWRFYPDSGKALAKWAVSQGQHVTLVESFIANRENDLWNDFVAVFRKGRITKTLPKVFLYEHVPSSNVLTWRSKTVINPKDEPEDLLLLREAKDRVHSIELALAETKAKCDSFADQNAVLSARLGEAEKIRDQLRLRENELTQRQEEIEQTRAELERMRSDSSSLRVELSTKEERLQRELGQRQEELERTRAELELMRSDSSSLRVELSAKEERLQRELEQRQEELEQARAEFERVRTERTALKSDLRANEQELRRERNRGAELLAAQERISNECKGLQSRNRELKQSEEEATTSRDAMQIVLQAERADAKARLNERSQEIAALSRLLWQAEAVDEQAREQVAWLQEAGSILVNGSNTLKARLLAILPAFIQRKRQLRVLRAKGLFDSRAYLEAHPDVAADKTDPLRHYLMHGIIEHRRRD